MSFSIVSRIVRLFSRHHSIKLYASKGAVTRIGGDFDLIGMALQYRWGGGL